MNLIIYEAYKPPTKYNLWKLAQKETENLNCPMPVKEIVYVLRNSHAIWQRRDTHYTDAPI